jgi:hypothetical protein
VVVVSRLEMEPARSAMVMIGLLALNNNHASLRRIPAENERRTVGSKGEVGAWLCERGDSY